MSSLSRLPLLVLGLALASGCTSLSPNRAADAAMVGSFPVEALPSEREGLLAATTAGPVYTLRPARRDITDARVRGLRLPAGFQIGVFADGLENPRILAVHEGHVYVTERDAGQVRLLQDTNRDGRADRSEVVAEDLDHVHGLAVHDGHLYMVGIHDLWRARIASNGTLGSPEQLRDDLPNAGQHPNRTLGFDRGGRMYLTIGSTTNAAPEQEEEMATIVVLDAPYTGDWQIYAEGLRNTIGFGWHPTTGELWGMDHGSDGRGNDVPVEELNRIVEGRHYGWPWCWGNREIDPLVPQPPDDMTRQRFCADSEPMVMGYTAHSAPMQAAFYTGSAFPAEYRNDLFVTMRGSWNRNPASGYEVVRVRFNDAGQPQGIETFASGWLIENGQAHFGRLVGLAQAPDGSVLITDDTNGVVYRIAHGS